MYSNFSRKIFIWFRFCVFSRLVRSTGYLHSMHKALRTAEVDLAVVTAGSLDLR